MIVTRTPLRISIGGGGTDLPSYYREHGGFVISAAIDKYIYIGVSHAFFPGYHIKYSTLETAITADQIKHPLVREAIRMHDVADHLDLVSLADVPAGTGLGSSGSFLVGLLHAIHAHKRQPVTAEQLAQEAVEIEMVRLGEPVGKQDQYIAAYGGLTCQEYRRDGTVGIVPLKMKEDARLDLRDSLALFFVGSTRSASTLLRDQQIKSESNDAAMADALHFTKQLGVEIKDVLERGDVFRFGELMHEHWMRKRVRSAGMSNERIDELYSLARGRGGAIGGKLVGAGGSGFLLFQARDRHALRRVMKDAGLLEMDFNFDYDGSVIQLRNH